jgi:hypothetical protein
MFRMFRFLLRMLGLLFLGAAFAFVVYDGTRSIADSALKQDQYFEGLVSGLIDGFPTCTSRTL